MQAGLGLLPGISDGANIGQAIAQPSATNIAAATIGLLPEIGGPLADIVKGSSLLGRAGKVLEGAKTAGQLGKEGEAAVRKVYDIGEKTKIVINGRTRIPDGISDAEGILSEVKNVDRLSFTQQLRDYATYSRNEGFRFDLYTRPGTRLSAPLQGAIDNGLINHLHIP